MPFSTHNISVLLSVGPGHQEIDRLHDFFDALLHWEPAINSVVLIDDALESRSLEELFSLPAGVRVKSILHPRRGNGSGVWGGLAEGILTGLEWIACHEPGTEMVLKIDTDALVIAPFAERAARVFAAHPKVGLIGLHDRQCSGETRSFWPWNRALFNYSLPVGTRRTPSGARRLRWQLFNAHGKQRRILHRARTNGYAWGEHCLGGAYILRGQTVRDLHRQNLLQDASFWRTSQVGEDVVVGAYTKAAGWDMRGSAGAGEIFGISYVGLPFEMEHLQAEGYSIIHSVKNHPGSSEEAIRGYFRRRRIASVPEPVV